MTTFRIDFDNPGIPNHMDVMEDDEKSRFFTVELYRSGAPYTAPSGATYSIMYRGPGAQNQGWYDTIEDGSGTRAACSVSGNVVTCEIARKALQVPGRVTVVLCVTSSSGYMLKCWPIDCHCQNDSYDSTAEIESFFFVTNVKNATWTEAIAALNKLNSTIDAALSPYVTAAREAAAQADKSSKTAANSVETTSQNAKKAESSASKASESASKASESANKADEILKRMDKIKGGYCMSYDISIETDSWKMSDTSMTAAGYPYQATLVDPMASPELEPNVTVLAASASVANSAGLCSQCETGKQKLSFWAKTKPTGKIKLHVMLLGKSTGGSAGSGEGMSDAEKTYVLSLLAHTIYDDALMQSIYDQLHALWDVEIVEPTKPIVPVQSITLDKTTLSLRVGNTATLTATVSPSNATDKTVTWSISPAGYATVSDGKVTAVKVGSCTVTATAGNVSATCTVGVIAELSSTSVPGETPVYKLATAKTFVAANKEYIDTGIKMFETIDPKPSWTILFEVQGGANAGPNQSLLHCMEENEPWPGLNAQIVTGGFFQVNIYNSNSGLCSLNTLKSGKNRLVLQINGDKMIRWNQNAESDEKTIAGYDTAVDKSLLIGCFQESDGTKGRFFDGTLYQCMVFHKALTDEQVVTWITT